MILQLLGLAIIAWAALDRPKSLFRAGGAAAAVPCDCVDRARRASAGSAAVGLVGTRVSSRASPRAFSCSACPRRLCLCRSTPAQSLEHSVLPHPSARDVLRDHAVAGLSAQAGLRRRCLRARSAESCSGPFRSPAADGRIALVSLSADQLRLGDRLLRQRQPHGQPAGVSLAVPRRHRCGGKEPEHPALFGAACRSSSAPALVILVGIALNGSLAGYGLALPVIAASALIVLPPSQPLAELDRAASHSGLVGDLVALATTRIGAAGSGTDATGSVQSRHGILQDYRQGDRRLPAVGIAVSAPSSRSISFTKAATRSRPNMSSMRTTIMSSSRWNWESPGILLMLAVPRLVGSCGRCRAWRNAVGGPFSRAASIASAAILVHSLVDFPLRTAAISACFAMCCALPDDRRAPVAQDGRRPLADAARGYPLGGRDAPPTMIAAPALACGTPPRTHVWWYQVKLFIEHALDYHQRCTARGDRRRPVACWRPLVLRRRLTDWLPWLVVSRGGRCGTRQSTCGSSNGRTQPAIWRIAPRTSC